MPHLTEAEARALVARAFTRVGVRVDMAHDAAQMLVLTEMMGVTTHGLARVENYVDRVKAGGVNPDAAPVITAPAPGLRRVDGQNGLGAAVAIRATRAAIEAARDTGIGAAFCRASSHLGALAPHLLIAAESGFAAIYTTNTSPMIAPAGAREAVIGNAPFGIAVPDRDGRPVILDMALSVVARSKVRAAAKTGAPIPETWATDANGNPTTNAAEAMQGLMQAIGGGKGATLALALDMLAGALSGAAMLSEIPNANRDPGAVGNVGHMVIVIDASALMPPDRLAERLKDARRMVTAARPIDPLHPARLPGDRAVKAVLAARTSGFTVGDALFDQLQRLAAG
jgi:LDH2 family malate/lactate/ureidoglycolate dehydrogenase